MQTYKIKIPLEHLLKNILPSNIQKRCQPINPVSKCTYWFSLFPTKMNSEGEGKNLYHLEVWRFRQHCLQNSVKSDDKMEEYFTCQVHCLLAKTSKPSVTSFSWANEFVSIAKRKTVIRKKRNIISSKDLLFSLQKKQNRNNMELEKNHILHIIWALKNKWCFISAFAYFSGHQTF